MGVHLSEQPVDLAQEKFVLYVPRQPPARGYGRPQPEQADGGGGLIVHRIIVAPEPQEPPAPDG